MNYLAELYRIDSKGKTRHWRIWTDKDTIYTEHGAKGGKLQLASKKIKAGKNIGKSNETSVEAQALSEATSIINSKRDKGYSENPSSFKTVLPMLAHDYKKRGKDIKFPCLGQPKLDGIRCLAKKDDNGEIVLYSRTGKVFPQEFNNIKAQLAFMDMPFDDEILDGELFTDKLQFEQITGLCQRAEYDPNSELVEFHCFDVINDDPFVERLEYLVEIEQIVQNNRLNNIRVVPTIIISSRDDIDPIQAKFINLGHEGLMLRNMKGLYKSGYRSKDLQKYKQFDDTEFKIIGAKEGDGKDFGTVIWLCFNEDSNEEFDCRPRGTYEQRKEWWENRDKYIGKLLTVRHQGYTNGLVPRFPVGIAIRDYE